MITLPDTDNSLIYVVLICWPALSLAALLALTALATLSIVIVLVLPLVFILILLALAPAVTARTPLLLIVVPLILIPVPAVYVVSIFKHIHLSVFTLYTHTLLVSRVIYNLSGSGANKALRSLSVSIYIISLICH